MSRDPILDEVRTIREGIAKEHDYDLDSIFEMLRQSAACSGRARVNLSASANSHKVLAAQLGVAAVDAY
jgi:hypothetical protein